MITENTLFILGAGASVPYGYPTGEGLKDNLINDTIAKIDNMQLNMSPNTITNFKHEYIAFANQFYNSSADMIDYFLASRDKYVSIGKLGIIIELLYSEKQSRYRKESVDSADDWMSYLYNKMLRGIEGSEPVNFTRNTVSFITFNYDRSLEYFFSESLQNFYDITPEESLDLVKSLNIHHVFGRLPLMEFEGPFSQAGVFPFKGYGNDLVSPRFAESIKTLHERENIDTNAISNLIMGATKIFFLGFGFAEENMNLLNMKNIINNRKRVFATALDQSDYQIEKLRNHLAQHIKYTENPRIDDSRANTRVVVKNCKSKGLLKDYL